VYKQVGSRGETLRLSSANYSVDIFLLLLLCTGAYCASMYYTTVFGTHVSCAYVKCCQLNIFFKKNKTTFANNQNPV
jgi:hypothetical protein